jgi:subtilisin family serine protease
VTRLVMPRRWLRLFGLVSAILTTIGLCAATAVAQQQAGKLEPAVASALSAGKADFYVRFDERADLTSASKVADWGARGAAVVAALQETADRSQAAARRQLDAAGVSYQPFWISNTILVRNASAAVANRLAGLTNVTKLSAPQTYRLPTPIEGTAERTDEATINTIEWNIAAIKADQVWSTFGVRGEGIVVANIDTGVSFSVPALVGKYRGNQGGGSFDHNYNWYDPTQHCANWFPPGPCDNNGHGTHTMGTMVGDDGGTNQIGVAPNARWITTKGCLSDTCGQADLLSSGQWIVAPTNLNNANPRPDLRPHIVNNSWGGGSGDPWYLDTVNAWRAAGIFPAFANGNMGPSCGWSGSPGDYAESYSSGAFGSNGRIAPFSSRGPAGGRIKPNLAAPGVNVRSAVGGDVYQVYSGTSMASPHTAGTVALIWAAAPSLVGDLVQTSTLLNQTAVDTRELTCGGSAGNNNVWGEGKLDALAAVTNSPRGPVGTLTGVVTNATTGAAFAGATVRVTGPATRIVTTDNLGRYTLTLAAGTYTVTASAFGFASTPASVTITANTALTRNFALSSVATNAVSGFVRDAAGVGIAGATVTIDDTPIPPATTSSTGAYSFASVPNGSYKVTATASRCHTDQTLTLTVDGPETLSLTLGPRQDSFGYRCALETNAYVQGTTRLTLTGGSATVSLPFQFPFYGRNENRAFVSARGHVSFLAATEWWVPSTYIPDPAAPNAAVYAFFEDLWIDASSGVFTRTTGTAPNRSFLIEWRNATLSGAPSRRLDVELELFENGHIVLRYRNLDTTSPRELGGYAVIGIENSAGTVALEYSAFTPSLSNTQAIRFRPPGT